ncbi:MAG: hypothetical protein KDC90_06910 [Ignavibacteriae bacterium]|nr:hypothetical protein [Ignavibacteriota bacterium]
MKYYNSNFGGLTIGSYSVLVFIVYLLVTIISGGSFEVVIPFIPTLSGSGIFNYISAVIIAGLWGYFLGFTFFIIYNFYDKKFSK